MKPTKKIFYSWQSDLDNKSNRYLIRDLIKKATKQLRKSKESYSNIEYDSDTRKVSGSPDIMSTILRKIENCSVFISDITITNSSRKGKKGCNSNVLFELGYAIAKLGDSRVICVFNTFYDDISNLPFDLRNRRCLTYYFDPSKGKKDQKIEILKLESSLKLSIASVIENKYSAVSIRFSNLKNEIESKILFISNITESNIHERRKSLRNINLPIHRAIAPELIVLNNGQSSIIDYKIKIVITGDFEKIGDRSIFDSPMLVGRKTNIKRLDKFSVIYSPDINILVPGDSYKINDLGFSLKSGKLKSKVKIKWQIISEEYSESGLLMMSFDNSYMKFEALERNKSIIQDEMIILEK